MSKFCGKCGSQLNENGLCPICHINETNIKLQKSEGKKNKSKKKSLIILITIIISAVLLLAAFFTLDFFDIIPTGVSKSLGLKSSGNFEIEADKDYVFTSQDLEYSVAFFCKPDFEFSSIELYCDNTNSKTASFYDDGNTENNSDLKEADGIYSTKIGVKESDVGKIKYHAVIKNGLRYYTSNIVEIEVKEDWADEELSVMEQADNSIQELLSDNDYQDKTFEQKSDSVNALLNELSSDESGALIIPDSICFDEDSGVYSFEYSNGCRGCVSIEDKDDDSDIILGENCSESSSTSVSTKSGNSVAPSESAINNSNILIMYDWYTDKDDILDFYKDYKESWNSKGMKTELSINPTVEQYGTQMVDNAIVLIAAHGSRYSLKGGMFNPSVTYSVICTHEKCDKGTDKKYKFDISQKNIVRANTEDGKFYWTLPSFYSSHYDDGELNNSIILINSCNGFGKDDEIDYDLASHMAGSRATVGFHNSVSIFWTYDMNKDKYYTKSYGTLFMENIVESLLNSETIGSAFDKAKKTIGDTQYNYCENYGYDYKEEDKNVYPLISGNSGAKLSVTKEENEYKVADRLLKIGDKYICSDGNAIYYKNSITENGRKIVDKINSGELMSDGKTLYFTVTNTCETDENSSGLYLSSGDGTQMYYQDDIYSVNIDGTNLQKEYSADHEVNFVTYYNNCIYYIDEAFENGKLTKFDSESGTSKYLVNAENACFIGNKIYYSTDIVAQNVELIENNVVNSIDLDTEITEEVASGSTLCGCVQTDDALYFASFGVEYDNKAKQTIYKDQYLYMIGKDNKIEKSKKLPNSNVAFEIGSDGSYVILTYFTSATQKEYYKYNIETGIKTRINSNSYGYLDFQTDLADSQDIYYVLFPANSGSKVISVRIYMLTDNGGNPCKVDGKNYIDIDSYNYWFVDGFFVDSEFKCYEIV